MTGFIILCSSSSLFVPHELSESILRYLKDDFKSLLNCALVCRSWTYASRSFLFEILTIQPAVAKVIFGLISESFNRGSSPIPSPTTPPAAAYCRTLRIQDVNIRNLECPFLVADPSALHRHPLRPLFPTLTSLTVSNSSFPSLGKLLGFVSCFSNLRILSLLQVGWSNNTSETILQNAITLPSITSLNIRNLNWGQFFAFINPAQALENVTRLSLGPIDEWDVPYVARYIFRVSSNLTYLSIQFTSQGDTAPIVTDMPADLLAISRSTRALQVAARSPSSNRVRDEYRRRWGLEASIYSFPKLISARFEDFIHVHMHKGSMQSNACFWAPRFLASMVAPNLETLELTLTLERAGQLDQYDINWTFMDYALGSEDYMSLKRLVFCVDGGLDLDSLGDLILARLPLMVKRGILIFCRTGECSDLHRSE